MNGIAKLKEPTLLLRAPQSEVLAAASAMAHHRAWLRRAHAGEEEALQIIAQLEQFHKRIVELPGLTTDARRYLDDLESIADGDDEP
jgi:hypothetical protein